MAAYAIAVGGVVGYAAWLARERRRLLALAAAGRQNAVDKKASREV
jgi:hypothetical protein